MSDGTNPVTSPAPAASEAVAPESDATMAKQTTETNGTSVGDAVVESNQEVAPDSVAPVEGMSKILIALFSLGLPIIY